MDNIMFRADESRPAYIRAATRPMQLDENTWLVAFSDANEDHFVTMVSLTEAFAVEGARVLMTACNGSAPRLASETEADESK